MAMEGTREGASLTEIQQRIDRKYADQRENRTPTPLPPLEGAAGGAAEGGGG